MVVRTSIQLAILFAMAVVCVCAKEYILEDLVAMEDNNRRNVPHNADTVTANNDAQTQKVTRQRQTTSVTRQKKADRDANNAAGEQGGNGNENGRKKGKSVGGNGKDDDDEDKKTLAQQVADGKYGLIQKEIFPESPKRPGIISYEVNPEVPKDNVNNLGGLKAEEIWLAENHLLVLVGGGKYNERDEDAAWPPIDNYRAPPRQVKIPPNPKVPPPFPVQLRPGGPTEFIRGENGTGGPPPYPPFFPPPGNFSGTGLPPSPFFAPPPGFHPGNFTPGNGPVTPFPYPLPQLPPGIRNGSIPRLPPQGPFPPGLPPGASFLPPPGNITDQLDEDDPSIYYPPPYDFVYKRDNSTAVPPGPLVPGIVLPPPPDFFAPLEDEKQSKPKRPGYKTKRPLQIPSGYRGKSEYRFPTTTKRPAVQIVTDEQELNEVTPATLEHVLPPNAEIRGWVPIPAPRPFYITGPRKPLVENPVFSSIKTGYKYDRPYTGSFSIPEVPLNAWNYRGKVNLSQPFVINSRPQSDQAVNVLFQPTTTPQPVPYQPTQVPKSPPNKAVKSFYFYDAPPRIPFENYFSTTRQPQIPNQQYFTTTVRPSPRPFEPVQQSVDPEPVQYFYITKSPQPIVETTTHKPPVYEYSYTAPGYGTIEEPKLTVLSTPPPSVIQQVTPIPQYDNSYYELYHEPRSSIRPPVQVPRYSTTTTPQPVVHSTTIRPGPYDHKPKFLPKTSTTTPSPYILQTENPYHSHFTPHDFSLIDDITKKYFTIFGQKINGADAATTPLPPLISSDEVTTKSPEKKPKSKIKFPVEQKQQPIILHTAGPNDYSYYWNSANSPSSPQAGQNVYPQYTSDYDYYEDVNYNPPNDYSYKMYLQNVYGARNNGRHSAPLVQRPLQPSYEGDTRVNFVQPLPTKNPDAEEFSEVTLKNRNQQSRLVSTNNGGRTSAHSSTVAPISLHGDTKVNYINPPQTPESDAEVFDPSKLKARYQQYANSYTAQQLHQASIRPPSLEDDTRVNYLNPSSTPDPDAQVFNPAQLDSYRNRINRPSDIYLFGRSQQITRQQSQPFVGLVQQPVTQSPRPPTLAGDTDVNYLRPRPPINPDAEFINPRIRQQVINNLFNRLVGSRRPEYQGDTRVNDNLKGRTPDTDALVFDPKNPPNPDFGDGRRGNSDIIAYRLPGNGGGHFYFLTPQTAVQQQEYNYHAEDAVEQSNFVRRNVRRQSGNGGEQEPAEDDEKTSAERLKQARRTSRTEERKRSSGSSNRNFSSNNSSSSNSNRSSDSNTTNDHTT